MDTLRRICEWFDAGWTTYRIADQLNNEGIKPVHGDHWGSTFIDGLLENSVLVGKPTWNRTSQSTFRHIEGGRIVDTNDEQRASFRQRDRQDWFQSFDQVFEPIIDPSMFNRIQAKLEARQNTTPKRSPKSEQLWLGGLWWDADSNTKLSGNSQGKQFKVKHPDHDHKRISFKEAEWFIAEYLKKVGQRIETLGEAVEDKKLLEKLATEEWMKELHFEYIVLEIESYLETTLGEGIHKVGNVDVIVDYDKERNRIITTEGDYLELYCQMVKDDMNKNQEAIQSKLEERNRLTLDLMAMKGRDKFIIDTYSDRIKQLSLEIETATAAPDYMEWWNSVLSELDLLRQQQATVSHAVQQGSYVQKAESIRRLIDRIECHWAEVPTTDGRYKSGIKTVCQSVTIHATAAALDKEGHPIPTMTIETPSG